MDDHETLCGLSTRVQTVPTPLQTSALFTDEQYAL